MPHSRRIYLDTNILIKLVEQKDADSVLLRQIVTSAGQSSTTRFCTSELSRAEVLVIPIRNKDYNLIAVYYNVLTDGGTLNVGPITGDITGIAAALRPTARRAF